MASLVLGAVGAVIGAPFGMASLGFSIGASLGGYLTAPRPPTLEGPRLSDLKIQSSNYGDMLPIVYGTARLAGKMIWSLPIKETRHVKKVSGGKGGSKKQKVVSYTYSQTFAVAVCEGPIVGVRKIWANGELIYNVGSDATAATIYSSNQAASGITIYTGSETQTANATIQANVGASLTPAYRGVAYVVFTNLQLAKFGNRTPNLEFEVVKAGAAYGVHSGPLFSPAIPIVGGSGKLIDGVLQIQSAGATYLGSGQWSLGVGTYSFDGALLGSSTFIISGFTAASPVTSQNDPYFNVVLYAGIAHFIDGKDEVGTYTLPSGATAPIVRGTVSNGLLLAYVAPNRIFLSVLRGVVTASLTIAELSWNFCTVGIDDGWIYIGNKSTLILNAYNSSFELMKTWDMTGAAFPFGINVATVYGGVIMFSGSASGFGPSSVHTAATLNSDGTVTSLGSLEDSLNGYHVQAGTYQMITLLDTISFDPKGVTAGTQALSAIGSDLCSRVGLAAGDVNVTALTDNVDGYVVARRMSARAALEPLLSAFFADGVESDGKIKFVKRGGAVATTITEDDLAARPYGGELADPIKMTRAQEMDLPTEVTVSYLDSGNAYQTGTQSSRRLITSSKRVLDLQLAIAMSASKAKQIADVMLYTAWTERNSAPISTDRSYAWYEPTDLIQATQGNLTWTFRIAGKTERDGIVDWQVVADDPNIYTQAGAAVASPAPTLTIDLPGPTQLNLLDIPLLRDADEGYGFYAAASGYLSGWTGAQMYKSTDGGVSWTEYGDGMLNGATQGYASTALGNFTGGNIFDEANSVTVILSDTLESIPEIDVLNGGNAILIGNEVLQFKTATLTATNTYSLTGLLRGRRGTEWAMSTHAIGDRVVLLTSTTIYRLDASSAELNLVRDYRGVSFDGYLDQAENISFANTAVGLECYSPVQIGGGRNAAGDLTINWVRRTRIGGEWRDYVDATLGESTESYEVDIMNGSTVVRTIAASSQTAAYTAAQQTTDFGSPQASISLKVYQLSAAVGRGYPGSATV